MVNYSLLKDDCESLPSSGENVTLLSVLSSVSTRISQRSSSTVPSSQPPPPPPPPSSSSSPSSVSPRPSSSSPSPRPSPLSVSTPPSSSSPSSSVSPSPSSSSSSSNIPKRLKSLFGASSPHKGMELEELLRSVVETAVLPTGIQPFNMHESPNSSLVDELQREKSRWYQQLAAMFGDRRASRLFNNHVRMWHYLLIHSSNERDTEVGQAIKHEIEQHDESMHVAGPWTIPHGEDIIQNIGQLLESSSVVLVLLSHALCEDELLQMAFPEALSSNQFIVPVFLEELGPGDLPQHINPLVHRDGRKLYGDEYNLKDFVKSVYESFSHKTHTSNEVLRLARLVTDAHTQDNFVCMCGDC